MARTGVPIEDIRIAIEDIAARGDRPTTIKIRTELGGTGSYTRISDELRKWRVEQTEQSSLAVPDIPDTVARQLQGVWTAAYREADKALEAKCLIYEEEHREYEETQVEMSEEIVRLENSRGDLETAALNAKSEQERLRGELEETRRDLAASTARAVTLEQQLAMIRAEQQTSLATIQDWMQRATTAEAELQASQVQVEAPKPTPRKRAPSVSNDG